MNCGADLSGQVISLYNGGPPGVIYELVNHRTLLAAELLVLTFSLAVRRLFLLLAPGGLHCRASIGYTLQCWR